MIQRIGPYRYLLDAQDQITFVSREWLAFAQENGAPHLTEEMVLGKPVWGFIADQATRVLYQQLFERVRKQPSEFILPFRCDSPEQRRFMSLTVRTAPRAGVELEGRLLRAESYQAPVLDSPTTRRTGLTVWMCSSCKHIRVTASEWVEVEQALVRVRAFTLSEPPRLRYAICPRCYEEVTSLLREKSAT
ncbi:MAG: hypothetical protein AB1898_04680 [Acidobacteriota bacterium]